MSKGVDKNTRYFIDLDLKTNKILSCSYAQKKGCNIEILPTIFSKGFLF